jgi:hypothetical protein
MTSPDLSLHEKAHLKATTPRSISPIQIAALEALARQTTTLMEMRRTIDELRSR